jgi:hypothetical protein
MSDILQIVKEKDPAQPEFHQSASQVMDAMIEQGVVK